MIVNIGLDTIDVRKYKERIEKLGAEVIILRGTIKRIGREREIRIKILVEVMVLK